MNQDAKRDVVWRPSQEVIDYSNLKAFMDAHGLADYAAFTQRASDDPDWFWNALIAWGDIRFDKPYDTVCDQSKGPEWATWCVGGTTNLALTCLDRHRGTPVEDKTVIVWEGEDGTQREWSYRELDAESCRIAGALQSLGIRRGDAVGIYLPMMPETMAAFFGAARIGAVIVPLFSGFGAEAIATRLNDGEAKALITIDGTWRRGRVVPMKAAVDEAAANIPSLRHVIVYKHTGEDVGWTDGRDHWWHEVTQAQPDRVDTVMVDADDTLLLVYTSGTTGKPKGILLTHCGLATKLVMDVLLCMDLHADDRMMWFSDFGWVVGPVLAISTTLAGATMVLGEGVPDFPEPGRMWRMVQDYRVSLMGTSPTAIRSLMRYGVEEVEKYDISSFRVFTSTGEPWTDEAWYWLFEKVGKGRLPLINWTGGTEIGGGILCGTVIHPMKSCGFAGSIPGMEADIVDEDGNSVGPDTVGELVMRAPSIGLSRGVWRNPERYIEEYWSMFPGMWRQGDWASRDADGMWYLHGRSDDTLKIAGKRTGPAEIEGLIMETGLVSEAAAVGMPDPVSGEAVMCVCVPAPNVARDDALTDAIKDAVGQGLGKAFRPKRVLLVSDLPKTRNMKIMRRVVRAVIDGRDPGDLTALSNPEAVDELRGVAT